MKFNLKGGIEAETKTKNISYLDDLCYRTVLRSKLTSAVFAKVTVRLQFNQELQCDVLHISRIAVVDKKYLSIGAGSALMKWAEKFAKKNKVEKITGYFEPFDENQVDSVYRFYRNNGFDFVQTEDGVFICKDVELKKEKEDQAQL